MTLGYALPYGLREVQLQAIDSAGVLSSTMVKLPVARTLSFSDTEDFEELRGDDKVEASRGSGPVVEWDLEAGGISLEAYAIMAGGLVTTTGVTPSQVKTFSKISSDSRPYFLIQGRSISDNGGDLKAVIYRAKADGSLEGEMADSAFWLTSGSGKGYARSSDEKVYDFVQSETAGALTAAT
jgi:hypothetical protein